MADLGASPPAISSAPGLELRSRARAIADVLGSPFMARQLVQLRDFALPEGQRIAEALTSRRRDDLPVALQSIEAGRERLLRDHSPLSDGSLGPPPPWDAMSVASACRASQTVAGARLLYRLAEQFAPRTVVELGTNLGISTAYLRLGQPDDGSMLATLDASAYRQALARQLHGEAGLAGFEYVSGFFDDTLAETLARSAPVDMAFLDGHHQYEPTLRYFATLAGPAADGCLFVFDDISWSAGMRRAWAEISRQPLFSVTVALHRMGLAVLRRAPGPRLDISLARLI